MNGSLGRRVAVAAALLIGFYVFAILVAGCLLAIAVLQWTTDAPQNVWVTAVCAISALVILGALIPRRKGFDAPGPRVDPSAEPRLHEMVAEVARSLDQDPPDEIYLAPDVNAGVSQRGGVLGFGGRRVMIIGLPLMDALTPDELRAVLAHEFAHYYGGDTRLGPIFFRTYDAIARAVTNLEEAESIMRHPFRWYGEFFLRRTAAIRRTEEFAADRHAARVAGAEHLGSALCTLEAAAPAWDAYMGGEFTPLLDSATLPPLLEGYHRFRSAAPVREEEGRVLEHALSQTTDRYDTHPSIGERLEALGQQRSEARLSDDRATSLLADANATQDELIRWMLVPDWWQRLRRIDWAEAPEIMLAGWREGADVRARAFADVTAATIPDAVTSIAALGRELLDDVASEVPGEQREEIAAHQLAVALGLALHDSGWTLDAPIGEPVSLVRDGERIEPFEVIGALRRRELLAGDWRSRCRELGIADLPLATQQAASAVPA